MKAGLLDGRSPTANASKQCLQGVKPGKAHIVLSHEDKYNICNNTSKLSINVDSSDDNKNKHWYACCPQVHVQGLTAA